MAGLTAFLVLLVLTVMLCGPATGMACPGCKEALFDPTELPRRLATAKGYAISIGLMLVVPLGLILGIVALIARAQRQARR